MCVASLTHSQGVDDKLGDPDVGYDYDSLVEAMQEDRLGKSDDDEEEEGASEEEGQDGSEGGSEAAEEGEEGSGDDEDEEEEGDAEVESLSGEEEGEEGGVPDVDDLEDSGDDEEQEWVMASPGQLEEQQQQQQSQQKGKKGKKAAPAPAQGGRATCQALPWLVTDVLQWPCPLVCAPKPASCSHPPAPQTMFLRSLCVQQGICWASTS
jgi:hypothetical protein